jgi:hypothetical protein
MIGFLAVVTKKNNEVKIDFFHFAAGYAGAPCVASQLPNKKGLKVRVLCAKADRDDALAFVTATLRHLEDPDIKVLSRSTAFVYLEGDAGVEAALARFRDMFTTSEESSIKCKLPTGVIKHCSTIVHMAQARDSAAQTLNSFVGECLHEHLASGGPEKPLCDTENRSNLLDKWARTLCGVAKKDYNATKQPGYPRLMEAQTDQQMLAPAKSFWAKLKHHQKLSVIALILDRDCFLTDITSSAATSWGNLLSPPADFGSPERVSGTFTERQTTWLRVLNFGEGSKLTNLDTFTADAHTKLSSIEGRVHALALALQRCRRGDGAIDLTSFRINLRPNGYTRFALIDHPSILGLPPFTGTSPDRKETTGALSTATRSLLQDKTVLFNPTRLADYQHHLERGYLPVFFKAPWRTWRSSFA